MKIPALISLTLLAAASASAFAFPKAIYVKQGDNFSKYNFGVASDLNFSNGGKTLTITGYGESINLDNVDYISFSAPMDNSALTPSAQKNKLIEVGQDVYNMINLHDNEELINMFDVFFNHYHDSKGDYQHPVSEFDVPKEYWNVHQSDQDNRVAAPTSPFDLMKAQLKLAKGDVSAIRLLKAKATDLYKVEDYFGIYSPDYDKQEWKRIAKADYFEMRFRSKYDGDNYVARLEASKEYNYWENKDVRGQLPKTMTITLLKGKTELAKTVITSNLVQDKEISINVDFNANGYVAINDITILDNKITDNVKVTINGKQLCDVKRVVNAKHLMDYDEMYGDAKEATHYHDENDNCCGENPERLIAHFIKASCDADVIGQLQLKGKIHNFSKMYDVFNADDYAWKKYDMGDGYFVNLYNKILDMNSNKSIISVSSTDKEVVESRLNYLNDFSDAYFCYDGKKNMQGYLGWEIDDDVREETPSYNQDYNQYAYTIIDGYLVDVHRKKESYYDETTHTEVSEWTDWEIEVYNEDWGWKKLTIADSDVIKPSIIKQIYPEITPVLMFPDLTSFMFEDFFDEISFKNLIDDYEDIIDIYENITGN